MGKRILNTWAYPLFFTAIITLATTTFGEEPNTPPSPQEQSTQTRSFFTEEQKGLVKELENNGTTLGKTLGIEDQLKTKTFIEQQISLAELNELIKKINEDLSSRLDLLDRPDREEIITVLKNKAKNLIKHLEEIEAIADPNHLKKSLIKPWQKKVLWGVGITAITLLIIGFFLTIKDSTPQPALEEKPDQPVPQEPKVEAPIPVKPEKPKANPATGTGDAPAPEPNPLHIEEPVTEEINPPAQPQESALRHGWGSRIRSFLPF